MKRPAVVLSFLVGNVLSGEALASCRTPLRTPCFPAESVREQWSILHRGVSYRHSKLHEILARNEEGSISRRSFVEEIPLVGSSARSTLYSHLYLRPQDRVVRIFHGNTTFSSREPLIWHDRPYRYSAGDDTCRTGIQHSGTDFRIAGEATILGFKTVHWHRALANGGYEDRYLAPALDCMALRSVEVIKNLLRIPTLKAVFQVRSMRLGEPDAALFRVPTGYRQVADPVEERMRRYVERIQRRPPPAR